MYLRAIAEKHGLMSYGVSIRRIIQRSSTVVVMLLGKNISLIRHLMEHGRKNQNKQDPYEIAITYS